MDRIQKPPHRFKEKIRAAGVKISLHNHQYDVIEFFGKDRESTHQKSSNGILADDMGLGKTISILTTIILNCYMHGIKLMKTLVISPASIIDQWRSEAIQKMGIHPDRIYIYHGKNRDAHAIRKMDIVITSYGTLSADFQNKNSALFDVYWQYIIADEAHYLKNNRIPRFKAVAKLRGKNRFALTGTPFTKSWKDFASLAEYLSLDPYCNPAYWRRNHSKSAVMKWCKNFMLRRTKDTIIDLPKKHIHEHVVTMNDDQRYVMNALRKKTILIIREYKNTNEKPSNEIMCKIRNQAMVYRRLMNDVSMINSTLRNSVGCQDIQTYVRQYITKGVIPPKIHKAYEIIRDIHDTAPNEKIIVYSQWPPFLGIMAQPLKNLGIPYTYYHGSMNKKQRYNALHQFKNSTHINIQLMSTMTAIGLNIHEANHVIFLDQLYTPFCEFQAANRVHRIGQTKEVNVHYIITDGPVEKRIKDIKKKKLSDYQSFLQSHKMKPQRYDMNNDLYLLQGILNM
jgi:SNF2 family DNA or RNA helicase